MGHKQEIGKDDKYISKSDESDEETYFGNHFSQYVSNFSSHPNSTKQRTQIHSPTIAGKEKEDKTSSIDATQRFLKSAILTKLKKNEIQANWKDKNELKPKSISINPKQHEIQLQNGFISKTPDELISFNVHQISEQTGYLHRLLSSKRSKTPTVSEYLVKNSKNHQRTKYFESTKRIVSENSENQQQVDKNCNIRARSNLSEQQQPQRYELLFSLGDKDTKVNLSNAIEKKNQNNGDNFCDKKEIMTAERDPFLKSKFRRLKLQINRNKEIKLTKLQYLSERHQLDMEQSRTNFIQQRQLFTAKSLGRMESPILSFNKCSPKIDSLFDSMNPSINRGTEEGRFEKYSVQEQLFQENQQKERDLRKNQHEIEQIFIADQIIQEEEDLQNSEANHIESCYKLPKHKEEEHYLRQINLCVVQNYLAFAVLLTSKQCVGFKKTEGSKQFSVDDQLRLSGLEIIKKEKTKSLFVNVESLKKMEDISFSLKQLWIPTKQAMKAGLLIKEQYSKRKNKDIVIWNLQKLLYDLNTTTQHADTGQKYMFLYTEELVEIQSLSEINDSTQLLIVSKQPLFAATLIGKLAHIKISPCVLPLPHRNSVSPFHSKGQYLLPHISQNLSNFANKLRPSRSLENRSLIDTTIHNILSPNEGSSSSQAASQLIDLLSDQIRHKQTTITNGKSSKIESKKFSLPSNREITEISSKIDHPTHCVRENYSYFMPKKYQISNETTLRYFSAPRTRMSSNLLSQSITPQRKLSLLARIASSPQNIDKSIILPQRVLK